MQFIQPQAFHLGNTVSDDAGIADYLAAVGAPQWKTDAPTGSEKLIEVLGRCCYRSFAIGLNPNVTKVREGNSVYLKNVVESRHGALIEHAYDTYALFNISRVVSHQIVRHRVGTNFSQESGHYVRVDGIKSWFPKVLEDHPKRVELFEFYKTRYENLEQAQRDLAVLLDIDNQPFAMKKKLTTAARRLVPDGIATTLCITSNHRSWRWMIELRTSRHNDEEIRICFANVFHQQAARYANLYFDAKVEMVEGLEEITFTNSKV